MIQLTINGKLVQLDELTRLLDYVASLGVDPRAIAVEVNGKILERGEYQATVLAAGDNVEIVRMVGGGARSGSRGWRPPPRRARPRARPRRP